MTSHSVTWPNFLNRLPISALVVPSESLPTNILVGMSLTAQCHTLQASKRTIITNLILNFLILFSYVMLTGIAPILSLPTAVTINTAN